MTMCFHVVTIQQSSHRSTTYKIRHWKHCYINQPVRTSKLITYHGQQAKQTRSEAGISCANLSFYCRRWTWSFVLGLKRLGNTTSLWNTLHGQTTLTAEGKNMEFRTDNTYTPSGTPSTSWVSSYIEGCLWRKANRPDITGFLFARATADCRWAWFQVHRPSTKTSNTYQL
jgi:hypothetical protein